MGQGVRARETPLSLPLLPGALPSPTELQLMGVSPATLHPQLHGTICGGGEEPANRFWNQLNKLVTKILQ